MGSEKLTKAQRETAERLRGQIGKCRAWISGYEAGSGKAVLEADSLRQVQIFLGEISETSRRAALREATDEPR